MNDDQRELFTIVVLFLIAFTLGLGVGVFATEWYYENGACWYGTFG